MKNSLFIGRRVYLDRLSGLFKEGMARKVVCIFAPGGVGKTRLIRESCRNLVGDSDLLPIVDFDDLALHTPENIELVIAQLLGGERFTNYFETRAEIKDLDFLHQQKLRDSFIGCLNDIALGERQVLFFDTVEKLESFETYRFLGEMFFRTRNFVFVVAGRAETNYQDFYRTLAPRLTSDLEEMQLEPFSEEESRRYLEFRQIDGHFSIDSRVLDAVIRLARGRPILLDLAIEWLSRSNVPVWLQELSVEDWDILEEAEKTARYEQFERQLVQQVVHIRSPLNRLALLLSHVYPLHADDVAELLNLTESDVDTLYADASTYTSFIKVLPSGAITLHDEMREMMKAHVWPFIDPEYARRRRDSQLASNVFGKKLEAVERELREQAPLGRFSRRLLRTPAGLERYLERETLHQERGLYIEVRLIHALRADVSEGFDQFLEDIQIARRQYDDKRLAQTLVRTVEREVKHAYVGTLTDEQAFGFRVMRARVLYDQGGEDAFHDAKKQFEKLLLENQDHLEREIELYNGLAACEVGLGQLDEALRHQTECLKRVHESSFEQQIPNAANYLGYIHRLRGAWQEAIAAYEQAFNSAMEIEPAQENLIATILNNWAYALEQGGKFEDARHYAEEAINIWQQTQNDKALSRGEMTLAAIYRGLEHYDESIQLLTSAIERLDEERYDYLNLVRAYFQLGWTYWFQAARSTESEVLLGNARISFNRSLTLAKKFDCRLELPGILHQSSNVYWLMGERSEARKRNDEAYLLSEQYHDVRYRIDSLVGKAEFDYADRNFDRIDEYAKELFSSFEEKGFEFPLFYGRMRRIQADVAFGRGNYREALPLYAEAIAQMQEHGGYGMYFVGKDELPNLEEKLQELQSATAFEWIGYLQEFWSALQPPDPYTQLLAWCDKQMTRVKLRKITS